MEIQKQVVLLYAEMLGEMVFIFVVSVDIETRYSDPLLFFAKDCLAVEKMVYLFLAPKISRMLCTLGDLFYIAL